MLDDQVKPTLLAELSGGGLSEKVEVFKVAGGSYEDTIMSNFLSQHPGGELVTTTCAGKDVIGILGQEGRMLKMKRMIWLAVGTTK